MPQYFTVAEADRLLPEIEHAMREAAALKPALEEAESRLRAATERVFLLGGVLVDRQVFLEQRQRCDGLRARVKESIEEIEQHGCVVKDLDLGLVDFPARFQGREVYLCWKLGEKRIGFWHGVEEGYRGRKPIDEGFLEGSGAAGSVDAE